MSVYLGSQRKKRKLMKNVLSNSSLDDSHHTQLQFFVRMISGGKSLVLHANSNDTVKSVHQRIHVITGIPVVVQRFIYRGKQLRLEDSLAECFIQHDAELQLVGRLRSTDQPRAWQVLDHMVSLIWRMCKGQNVCPGNEVKSMTKPTCQVKSMLTEFLHMMWNTCDEKAAGLLQVFMYSCAPAALVMLYLSANVGNKKCAKDLIDGFISTVSKFPNKIHLQCAPVLLEFVKLLRRKSQDDAMYKLCRSSLCPMVECIGISTENNNALIMFRDILLFVTQLATKLSHDLRLSVEYDMVEDRPLLNDYDDFAAYLLILRTVIKEKVTVEGPISIPFCEVGYCIPCYGEEVKILYCIFVDLLEKMYLCLGRVEEWLARKEKGEGKISRLGWCHYLSILEDLNSVSKLFQGAEKEFWTILRHRKESVSFLVTRFVTRWDDHRWILEHKEVTNFNCRRHLATMLLPEVKNGYDYEAPKMLIDRSQLLAESFKYIAKADPKTLHGRIVLKFINEKAIGPGVLREWFCLVCQETFNRQNALFVACPNDRRRFFPNPASEVHPLHLEYFAFSGRVIALALMHKVQVGIVFDRILFLQLAGINVSLEDIRDADPFLYSSCNKILEMDPETVDQDALGLTFVQEVVKLGSIKVVELCLDGKNISVNSKNRREYVDLLIQHHFVTSISEQITHFAQGFSEIMHSSDFRKLYFQTLELEDFDLILYGHESEISVEDWKAHTKYNGYKEKDRQICWFWESVEKMSAEQKKVLLFFWTSIKYLPVEGFSGLASRLCINKSSVAHDHLPSSHTCFFMLCFPPYPSLNVLQDRLCIITQEHVGCSFGTL